MTAVLGHSVLPLKPVNPVLQQNVVKRQPSTPSFSVRSCTSAAIAPVLVAFTRRRAKKDDGPGGVQKWFEEKKAQGTAGVGGAVIGGMLGGPLGAVVGSQVASKLGPVLNDALDALEVDEAEDAPEDKVLKEGQRDNPGEAGQAESRKVPKQVEKRPTAKEPPLPPKSSSSQTQESNVKIPPESNTKPPPQAEPQTGFTDELQQLRDSVADKQTKLKAEIEDLYAKAEEALKAGDEAAAREFLEARSKSQKSLEKMMEGEGRRAQLHQDKLNSLDAQAEVLYSKAEKALKAGEDEMARLFLQDRQKILQQRQQLEDSVVPH